MDGIELLNLFLRSFFLTLALEYPVLLLFRVRNRHDLLLALPVNLLTNPAAVALHLLLRPFFPSLPLQALIETGVVLAEWKAWQVCGTAVRRPLLLSLCSNGFSWSAGMLLQHLLRF